MCISFEQGQLDNNPITCHHGIDTNQHCKECDAYFHRISQKEPLTIEAVEEAQRIFGCGS